MTWLLGLPDPSTLGNSSPAAPERPSRGPVAPVRAQPSAQPADPAFLTSTKGLRRDGIRTTFGDIAPERKATLAGGCFQTSKARGRLGRRAGRERGRNGSGRRTVLGAAGARTAACEVAFGVRIVPGDTQQVPRGSGTWRTAVSSQQGNAQERDDPSSTVHILGTMLTLPYDPDFIKDTGTDGGSGEKP